MASLLFLGTVAGFGQTVPDDFLGVHTNHVAASWPLDVTAHIYRTLNSTGNHALGGSEWSAQESTQGVFNFGLIDLAMANTAAAGVQVTVTPTGVPTFYVGHDPDGTPIGWSLDGSKRRHCGCNTGLLPDHCFPPEDINADGSGTDAAWSAYITAFASHVHAEHVANPSGYSDVSFWENGNEWTYNGPQFCGSFAQMARMLMDEKCIVTGTGPGCEKKAINASAQVMTIALNGGSDPLDKEYLATVPNVPEGQPPAQLADIFNYHCYGDVPPPGPEAQIGHGVSTVRNASLRGMTGKRVVCTEGGWLDGKNLNHPPPDTWPHAADWIARFLLGLSSSGVSQFIAFGYDFHCNANCTNKPGPLLSLYDPTTVDGCDVAATNGYLCLTGVAWNRIALWITGITYHGPCTSTVSGTGHIWTCNHASAGADYKSGQFAWFDVTDETAFYQVPSGFTRQQDMSGVITNVVGGESILLSTSPVLLMNDAPLLAPSDLTSTVAKIRAVAPRRKVEGFTLCH